jgi:hypothetical protein
MFGATIGVIMVRKLLFAAIAATFCVQSGISQEQNFAQRIEHIVGYMTAKAKQCLGPALEGEQPFEACLGDKDAISLTISTSLPVRDGDGRVVGTCPATLTATMIIGFSAVKMDPGVAKCPEKTIASGEFAQIFVRILLKLGEWVEREERPA